MHLWQVGNHFSSGCVQLCRLQSSNITIQHPVLDTCDIKHKIKSFQELPGTPSCRNITFCSPTELD